MMIEKLKTDPMVIDYSGFQQKLVDTVNKIIEHIQDKSDKNDNSVVIVDSHSSQKEQIHAGLSARPNIYPDVHWRDDYLWHTDDRGEYWCGRTHHLKPEQLLFESLTTIIDLCNNHPELIEKMRRVLVAEGKGEKPKS